MIRDETQRHTGEATVDRGLPLVSLCFFVCTFGCGYKCEGFKGGEFYFEFVVSS